MRIFLTGATGVIGRRVLPMSNRKLRRTSGWVPRYASVREGWPAVVEELRPGREPPI